MGGVATHAVLPRIPRYRLAVRPVQHASNISRPQLAYHSTAHLAWQATPAADSDCTSVMACAIVVIWPVYNLGAAGF